MFGGFHFVRFYRKAGAAAPLRELLFYNEKGLYEERIRSVSNLSQVGVWKYDQFATAFQYKTHTSDEHKDIVMNRFKKAKAELVKAVQVGKTPTKEMVARVVGITSVTLAQ
jgi:hypothetical protein